jgi:hypothetical protein
MAIGETARLIASLELQDKFSGTSNKAIGQIGKLEGTTGRAARGMGVFGHSISTALGVGLASAVSSGIGLVSRAVIAGSESLNRLELATAATNQVLKSTKGVSGQTAAGIQALADQFENLNPLIGDEFIQAGENMLLTFTNIRGKAFKPATEALLDMNQAMGGGEEGLTKTAIQLGKALNDPAKGMTALQRVGVTFTAEQQKRIKALQKEGKLYEAQQVILKELSTEFGGQFAKAGTTAAASQARLKDAVEDAERALAKGLLPGVGRVRDALTKLLADPKIQTGILSFGERISSFLTTENINKGIGLLSETFASIKGVVTSIPWGAIGDALKIGGVGAKAILDAFNASPDWLKTAVITGWGLNKLTGGLAGSLFGGLASGLIKGILGIKAGVVNVQGAVVNAPGGVPTPGGGAPAAGKVPTDWFSRVLPFLPGLALGVSQIGESGAFNPGESTTTGALGALSEAASKAGISIKQQGDDLKTVADKFGIGVGAAGTKLGELVQKGDTYKQALDELIKSTKPAPDPKKIPYDPRIAANTSKPITAAILKQRADAARAAAVASQQRTRAAQAVTNLAATERTDASRAAARSAGLQAAIDRGRQATQTGLAVLAAKDFSPTVRVNVTANANIVVDRVVRSLTSFHIATSGTGGLTVGPGI